MRTGAERAAGVDDDRRCVDRRRLPRRPEPHATRPHRSVELAPAVLPARLDVGDVRVRKRLSDRGFPGGVDVRRKLDVAAVVDLLEAVRRKVEKACDRVLALRPRNAQRDPDEPAQRNALLSRSKKPSSRR